MGKSVSRMTMGGIKGKIRANPFNKILVGIFGESGESTRTPYRQKRNEPVPDIAFPNDIFHLVAYIK